jgi:hypothetical protein
LTLLTCRRIIILSSPGPSPVNSAYSRRTHDIESNNCLKGSPFVFLSPASTIIRITAFPGFVKGLVQSFHVGAVNRRTFSKVLDTGLFGASTTSALAGQLPEIVLRTEADVDAKGANFLRAKTRHSRGERAIWYSSMGMEYLTPCDNLQLRFSAHT